MRLRKFIFKIIVVGAPNVGKNSFLHQNDVPQSNFYNMGEKSNPQILLNIKS